MVMKGYLNQPASIETHNSKDLGWMDDDCTLFLEMRRKDLIVTGGENVNPKEVEDILISMEEIIDAVVVGIPDEEWGQTVTAFIIAENKKIEIELITSHLKNTLSNFKIPKKFHFVPSIPRNELGKINITKLKFL